MARQRKIFFLFSLFYFPFDLIALLLILLLFGSSDIASVKLFVAAVSA